MDETRRATAHWTLTGANSEVTSSGEGTAVVSDDGVTIGPVSIEFLDNDSVSSAEWKIELGLWPAGMLTLSQLARRFDSFTAALNRARDAARLKGMLAHGVSSPTVFTGSVREPFNAAASLLVFDTHLAVIPEGGDPFQIPFGTVEMITHDPARWTIEVESSGELFAFGQLARQTGAFAELITKKRDALAKKIASVTGSKLFRDGLGIPLEEISEARQLLSRWSAPERDEYASALLRLGGEARLGVTILLDPDRDSMTPRASLGSDVAAFLLVSTNGKTILEILSGPSAATYVFRGDAASINRNLQRMHFRRRALSFLDGELTKPEALPYRLALRRLTPLRELRAATAGRIIHSASWQANLEAALAG